MNPTLEQLAQYIAQELSRGIPESTIRAGLIQRGWTTDWVDAGIRVARQQAMALQNQTNSPQYMPPAQPSASQSTWQASRGLSLPAEQPAQPQPSHENQDIIVEKPAQNRTRAFLILGIILIVLIAIGAGAYFIVNSLNRAEKARLDRDARRKEHLSLLLNELSDYYVANSTYPTKQQLDDPQFLRDNGFDARTLQDPQWTAADVACTKDGKAVFAVNPTIHCYSYESTTSEEGFCDNKDTPCVRMKITILPEKQKQPDVVIFDQNSEVDS
ncbi:MAG TPA: hypothetical protein VF733_04560 [Candidatus Saccharimonadales bacterium]